MSANTPLNNIYADPNVAAINILSGGATALQDTGDAINHFVAKITNANINAAQKGALYFPPRTYTIKQNVTVPAGVLLRLELGAVLSVASGKTLTINGPIEAGRWQIFSGSGTVAIEGSAIYPEWFGAVGDGTTNDATAIQSAITAAGATGGGQVLFREANYATASLLTLSSQYVTLKGVGEASKITCSSTTGAVLFSNSFNGIVDLWIHCTGAGAYCVKSYNGKIFSGATSSTEGRGPEGLTLRNVKLTGASGIAYGLQLINTWFSRFDNIKMPGGDGQAIQIQSGGFNHFSHVGIHQLTADTGYNAWDGGIELLIQPDLGGVNSVQQADDNLFENCNIDGINGYDLYIHSAGTSEIVGVGPARNKFDRCLFGSNLNTQPCVLLTNAWWTTFSRCHAEHIGGISQVWQITNTAVANAWYNCSGEMWFTSPDAYQTIQGNGVYDHVNDITLDNLIWGTTIYGGHGTITDSAQRTYIVRTPVGTAGALTTTNKVPFQTFSKMNSGDGASGTLYFSNGAPSDAVGSDGDLAGRDNATAVGAALYYKRSSVWEGIAGFPFRKTATFQKTGIADNSATGVFTITTTNETGNVDGGAFLCNVTALVTHIATNGAAQNAAIKYRGSFTRQIEATATDGNNTSVEDTFTGTSIASTSATRDIASVTMTVTETSEYVQTVNFTVDLNGSDVQTAEVTAFVELIYTGFLTPPALAAA